MHSPASCSKLFYLLTMLLVSSYPLSCPAETFYKNTETDTRPRHADNRLEESTDEVSPHSGDLALKYRDVSIPGNGGLDINVWRTYSLQSASAGLASTHSQSYLWAALGPGWRISASPRISFEDNFQLGIDTEYAYNMPPGFYMLCTGQELGRYKEHSEYLATLEQADGSKEPLYYTAKYTARTKNGWKVNCSGGAVTAYAPDGVKYEFGSINSRSIGLYALSAYDIMDHRGPSFVVYPTRTTNYLDTRKITDPHGNTLTFTYKSAGIPRPVRAYPFHGPTVTIAKVETLEKSATLLTEINSSDGRKVVFTYNTAARLSSVRHGANVWTYEHLAPDALNARTLSVVTLPTGRTWKYTYQPGAFTSLSLSTAPLAINNSNVSHRKISQITSPSGGVTRYAYELYNLKASVTWSGAPGHLYLRGERVTKRTRSDGANWTYTYLRGSAGTHDKTIITGPDGQSTYEFMGFPFAMSKELLSKRSQNNGWQLGQLMKLTYPDGSSDSYTWQKRLVASNTLRTLELGAVWDDRVWAADLQQRVTVRDGATYTTQFSNYDTYGNPGTRVETGPNGGSRTTTLTYYNDPTKWIIGVLKDESFPGSSVTRTFDANGKVLSQTRDGVVTQYTYDPQGNLASQTRPGDRVYTFSNYKRGIPQTEAQPEGITLTRVVDDAGNVTAQTDAEGGVTRYTYDAANRVTSMTPPIGTAKTFAYAPTSQTTQRGVLIETTQYDPFGRAASTTLDGITTRYEYDALGRRTFVSHPGATTGTRYQYDALGRVIRVINADGTFQSTVYGPGTQTVTDERGKVSKSTYRSYGDPEQRQLLAIAAAEPAANVTLTRNTRDQVTAVTQYGLTRNYTYNANGYLVSVTNPETGVTTYGRDIAGNMTTRAVGASGVTRYTYDGQDRLTSVVYPGTTPAISNTYNKTAKLLTTNATGGNRSFTYDAAGNLIQETLALDGKSFTAKYAYNGLDQLSSVTYPQSGRVVNYAPDALGRPTIVSGYVSAIKYWPSGLIRQITYANGTVTNYGQNPRLWPATFSTQKTGGSLYLDSSYTYDGTGNLLTIGDTTDSAFNRTLGYDNINRLTNVAGFWGDGSIAYSGGGNILKQTLGQSTLNYSYDAQNRLNAVSGLRASSYGYDAYGNISSSQGTTYAYDGVPNLVCINCANPVSKVEYSYDGLNHRSSVTKAGAKVYEMHDSKGKQLIELDGARLTEYLYLGDKRIAQRVSP